MKKNNWFFSIALIVLQALSVRSLYKVESLRRGIVIDQQNLEIHRQSDVLLSKLITVNYDLKQFAKFKDHDSLSDAKDNIFLIPKDLDILNKKIARSSIFNLNLKTIEDLDKLVNKKLIFYRDVILKFEKNEFIDLENDVINEPIQILTEIRNNILKLQNDLDVIHNNQMELVESSYTLVMFLGFASVAFTIILMIVFIYLSFIEMKKEKEKNRELNTVKTDLENALNLKDKFLAIVSHEIRTPLNGIIGLADVLRKKLTDRADSTLAEVIFESGQSLLGIINDILDFSKIKSGNFVLENAPTKIIDVVSSIFKVLISRAREKGLLLKYRIDPKIPKVLILDSARVSQILYNLIGNALKFTKEGSVILRLKLLNKNEVEKTCSILFYVEDTGIGIPENDKEQLFKPFTKYQSPGTSGEPGSGMGLSIADQLVRQMGGQIEVDSELNFGTKVSFTLNFQYSDQQVNEMNNHNHQEGVFFSSEVKNISAFNSKQILVAEDNPTNQITIKHMLRELGFDVRFAANGQEAVELVEKSHFDLVLMDIQMPVLDGLEACKKIRIFNSTVPIIALSAKVMPQEQQNCIKAGMNDFLSKPVTLMSLEKILFKYFKENNLILDMNVVAKLGEKIGSVGALEVVKSYLDHLPELREKLKRYYSNNDFTLLKSTAHRYKSSSATVGAIELNKTLDKIENLDECKEPEPFQNLVNEAIKQSQLAQQQLEKLIQS